MDADVLIAALQHAVPGAHVERASSIDLQTTVYVASEEVEPVARALRDVPELGFALLAELTAVDYWPKEPRYELVYLLVSIANRHRLRMKVRLPNDAARIATVTGIWPGANWLEREVWDLFGIAFDGHPDPRRLLMPEDWEGHPLRKDYPVQIHMTPRAAEALQVTPEEFRANVERDRLARHD
jgi:NADH-quinone oxidoreductase subunit C